AVLGVRDLFYRAPDELFLRVAENLAQPAVHRLEAPAEIDVGDARGREREGLPIERLARAQRELGIALLGDVADSGDDAVPVGFARAPEEAGVYRHPGHRAVGAVDADDLPGQRLAALDGQASRPLVGQDRRAVGVHARQQRGEAGGADDLGERQPEDALGGQVSGDDVKLLVVDQDAVVGGVDHRAEALLALAQRRLRLPARRDVVEKRDLVLRLAAGA